MIAFLKKHAQVVGLAAAVLIILSGFAIYRQFHPSRPADPWAKVWCYDLNTGKLFVATEASPPPLPAPSGTQKDGSPAGVRADVYACGSCADESKRFIGALWKFNPEVHARVLETIAANPNGPGDNNPYLNYGSWGDPDARQVAHPDAKPPIWYPESSALAQQLLAEVPTRCKGPEKLVACVRP